MSCQCHESLVSVDKESGRARQVCQDLCGVISVSLTWDEDALDTDLDGQVLDE